MLANFVAMREGQKRPALIFGTSSDRIGTPDGQAYFFTFSKDLSTVSRWPVAPYFGASYGTWENDLRAIGGVHVRLPETNWAMTLIHDGKALHPTLEYRLFDRHSLSLLWVDAEELGLAYSVVF